MKTLIVIQGPTCIGKTSLAIDIAIKYNTCIVSADARQIYKEMCIGTAAPSLEDMQHVPHYFIHSHSIKNPYNVGLYEKEGLALLYHLFSTKDTIVMAGGSGLYIKAICHGIDFFPTIEQTTKRQVNHIYEQQGIQGLKRTLQDKDPSYYKIVDENNHRRLIRALEVCLQSNKTYSSFLNQEKKQRTFRIIKIGLCTERKHLYEQINQRVDQMMSQGLLQEVLGLHAMSKKYYALDTVGYRELFDYIDGKHNLETAISLIKRNTRRYAKRQITWFKKDADIHWFNPKDIQEIFLHIENYL